MTDERLENGLARISGRLQARRDAVRQRLETRPELSAFLERLKATFGPVRLTFVQVGDWSDGDPDAIYRLDGQPAHRFTPAPYVRPAVGRKGKAAMMRERENAQP
jgi:hypothetical protein